jgi:hypothetical protein
MRQAEWQMSESKHYRMETVMALSLYFNGLCFSPNYQTVSLMIASAELTARYLTGSTTGQNGHRSGREAQLCQRGRSLTLSSWKQNDHKSSH